MTNQLTAVDPSPLRILTRNRDGSGVIEMPVLVETPRLDLSRAAGGSGVTSFGLDDLSTIVENFRLWPGPVPINVSPHRPYSETSGPAPGFIEDMRVDGKRLMARVFLTRELFASVSAGQWRGFSVDAVRDPKLPTIELQGWAVVGGVFTNRPATDTTFALDPATAIAAETRVMFTAISAPAARKGVQKMSEQITADTASLEAQLAERDHTIETLETRSSELRAEFAKVKAELEESRAEAFRMKGELQTLTGETRRKESMKAELETRLDKLEVENQQLKAQLDNETELREGREVLEVIKVALATRNIPPVFFAGHEENPAAWLRANFASLDALRKFCETAPRLKTTALSSGRSPEDAAPTAVDKDVAAELKRLGLDPSYVGVTKATDLPSK